MSTLPKTSRLQIHWLYCGWGQRWRLSQASSKAEDDRRALWNRSFRGDSEFICSIFHLMLSKYLLRKCSRICLHEWSPNVYRCSEFCESVVLTFANLSSLQNIRHSLWPTGKLLLPSLSHGVLYMMILKLGSSCVKCIC